MKEEYFDIFPNLILKYADRLHSGELHKGRFIGMYMEEIKKLGLADYEEIHLKYPQFVSNPGCNRSDNWLDYIVNMDEDEFKYFKKGIEYKG